MRSTAKPKVTKAAPKSTANGASGKQTTLMGMKKPSIARPLPVQADSLASIGDTDLEETQADSDVGYEAEALVDESPALEILGESLVQPTMSPEPEEGAEETYL